MALCKSCFKPLPIWSFQKLCRECRRERAQDRARVLEFEERSPWSSPTYLLLGANIAVYMGMLLAGVDPMGPSGAEIIRWGGDYGALTLTTEPWRAVTASFVHIGFIHLALNMWCLFMLGNVAEHLFGRVAVIPLYVLTGVSGSLLSLWWSAGRVSAGASGAVFGIAGALIAAMYFCRFPVPKDELKDSAKSLVPFVGYNLLFGFMPGINNMAHLGGLLGGAVLGVMYGRVLVPPRGSPLQPIRPIDLEQYQRWRLTYALAQPVIVAAMAGVLVLAYGGLQRASGGSVRMHAAMDALAEQDWDRAIRDLRAAEAAGTEDPAVYRLLASAYMGKKDWKEVAGAYERGLAAFPEDRLMAVGLGWAHVAQKDYARALAVLEKFEARAGADEMTITLRAQALDGLDRHAEALQAYEQGRREFPQVSGLLVQQAVSHLHHEETAAAVPLLERAAEMDPADADTVRILSDAYQSMGRSEDAQAAMKRAEQLEARSPRD